VFVFAPYRRRLTTGVAEIRCTSKRCWCSSAPCCREWHQNLYPFLVSSWMARRISGFGRASCLVLRRDAECSTFGMARYLGHDLFTRVKHLGHKMKRNFCCIILYSTKKRTRRLNCLCTPKDSPKLDFFINREEMKLQAFLERIPSIEECFPFQNSHLSCRCESKICQHFP